MNNTTRIQNAKLILAAAILTTCSTGCGVSVTEAVDEVVRCRSMPGDRSARTVDAWKYDLVSEAALQIDPGKKGLTLPQLMKRLQQQSNGNLKTELVDFEEVVEFVILEMEVRGQFARTTKLSGDSEIVYFNRPEQSDSRAKA